MRILVLTLWLGLTVWAQEATTARVVVYRPKSQGLARGAFSCDRPRYKIEVFDGFKKLGKIARGEQITAQLTPGRHSLRTKSEVVDLDLRAGESYYLLATAGCTGHKWIEQVSCDDAFSELGAQARVGCK